jgi:hypothetical protein
LVSSATEGGISGGYSPVVDEWMHVKERLMSQSNKFSISFLRILGRSEQMFLSVTPDFEHGPGIERDGITAPRMRDPHSIPHVCEPRGITPDADLPYTTNPLVQRAGTWTLYHHLKRFHDQLGKKWQIIGAQSCGDLTMNPWHLAFIRCCYITRRSRLCALLLEANTSREPFDRRIYRSLVKWDRQAAKLANRKYEVLDIVIHEVPTPPGYSLTVRGMDRDNGHLSWLNTLSGYDSRTRNIAPFVDFILTGKPIVENCEELSLPNAIDRFQDVRHIFNLPTVHAQGAYKGQLVQEVSFGEYQLFRNLNERRAALSSAVIIDLHIGDHVAIRWEDLEAKLIERHFKPVSDAPTRRGQYRRYTDDVLPHKIEIFFPHNVYPFGVLGCHEDQIVCLASGGLSGRVGNTLEGIARIMFDFFGSDDAVVLDEGYDTFQIINPKVDEKRYRYTNEELLCRILQFTKAMVDKEHKQSLQLSGYEFSGGMKSWPLNKPLFAELDEETVEPCDADYSDVMAVEPGRSQVRSVVVFAAEKEGKARQAS